MRYGLSHIPISNKKFLYAAGLILHAVCGGGLVERMGTRRVRKRWQFNG